MKKLLCMILALVMSLTFFGCTNTEESQNPSVEIPEGAVALNVMSYNMLGKTNSAAPVNGDGTSETANLTADLTIATRGPKVNAMLNGERIDIAGLQEVSTAWQAWLDNGLSSKYAHFGQATASTKESCTVIYRVDKFNLLSNGAFWLAPGAPTSSEKGWDTSYDRLCVWGILQVIETGEYIAVMNTHLDHKGMQARIEGAQLVVDQMELLRKRVENMYGVKDCPVILTGDMNSNAEHRVYSIYTKKLNDSFTAAADNKIAPEVSTAPDLHYISSASHMSVGSVRIDYVYTSKENVVVGRYNMLQTSTNLCPYGPYMSDHNAVVVSLYITN